MADTLLSQKRGYYGGDVEKGSKDARQSSSLSLCGHVQWLCHDDQWHQG